MPEPSLKLVTDSTDVDAEIAEAAAEREDRIKSDAIDRASGSRTGDVLPPIGDVTYDDLSNAERFLRQFGDDIRYLAEAKKWLFWNRTHWQFDQENFVYELATLFVKNLYIEATDAASFRHAARSNNAAGIDNMLKIARNKRTITTDDLDQRPQLFNCQNGTIDLTTGELREHDRNDFITKISPFSYNPDATCDRFLTFLDQIQPNKAIQRYLQHALGYSMSATYTDRAFFILYGFGRNGKSVFVDLFSRIFGNYSQNTTADSLMRKSGSGIPNDIARLRGSRFITCSETEEGKTLHESLLKSLTGGDKITARFLFGEFFDFYFSGKLWIVTNHKPTVRDTSTGFWDRLKLVPFTTSIEKEKQIDKDTLINELLTEASGILAWLVAGHLEYYRSKQLVEPDEIKAEVAAYKFEQDSIAQFIAECCETVEAYKAANPQLFVNQLHFTARNPEVYAEYKKFCEANGEFPRSQRRLSQNLAERGFTNRPEHGVRTWHGFRLQKIDV